MSNRAGDSFKLMVAECLMQSQGLNARDALAEATKRWEASERRQQELRALLDLQAEG